MKWVLIILVQVICLPTWANPCDPYLRFEPNLAIDPRLSQALPGVGLTEQTLLDMLRGPRVLVEDPFHPSDVLRVLYARSPVDGAVYATRALVEEHLDFARVFDLVHIRRELGLTAEHFDELIEAQGHERSIDMFAAGYRPAEYRPALDRVVARIEAAVEDGPAGEDLSPANDDDDDRIYLGPLFTGTFTDRVAFITSPAVERASVYRLAKNDLVSALARAQSAGLPFTRKAAYRLGIRWPMDERMKWFAVAIRGEYYALLTAAPNARSIDIVDLAAVPAAVFRENPAGP